MNSRPPPRILRTEVLWTNRVDDPDEECPIPIRCDRRRRRQVVLAACAATLVVLSHHGTPLSVRRVVPDGPPRDRDAATGAGAGSPLAHARRHAHQSVPLPLARRLSDADAPAADGDVPYFFHPPRSMGQTVKDILGQCVGLRTTNATATLAGIRASRRRGVVKGRHKVDFIFTPYVYAGATLFDKRHRGRMFTFLRHPIERAVSLFYYLPKAPHEPTFDPDLGHVSLEMWARSKRVEHNWLTRFLSDERDGNLTRRHLGRAKAVLRRKCLVGLVAEKAESWLRLERFFGWTFYKDRDRECLDRLLNWGWSNKNRHPALAEGSVAWELLARHNELDMQLYAYAQRLFEEQGALFGEGGSLVNSRQGNSG